MQILISGEDTSVNNTVAPTVNEVTLFVNGMAAHKLYTIQIAALNSEGKGPMSAPLEIELDPLLFEIGPERDLKTHIDLPKITRLTLIIIVIMVISFVLILISGILLYKRRLSSARKPSGYLEAASTEDDFHPCHLAAPHHQQHYQHVRQQEQQAKDDSETLWIGKRWMSGEREEKESNSSEKKLLPNSNSNSDTEYTYVDRHNVSSFTASSGGSRMASGGGSGSPEPYATTEIFRNNPALMQVPLCTDYQQYLRPDNLDSQRTYASPICMSEGIKRGSPYKISDGGGGGAFSCDDLSRKARSKERGRKNKTMNGATKNYLSKPRLVNPNLLDILPPPPQGPPPPQPHIYGASQESVISPKYLFQHPVYQSTAKQIGVNPNRGGIQLSRVGPSEIERNSGLPRSDDEAFTRLLHREEDLDRDLENELQIFNDAITRFSEGLNRKRHLVEGRHQDDELLNDDDGSCDADGEDNSSVENH